MRRRREGNEREEMKEGWMKDEKEGYNGLLRDGVRLRREGDERM